MFEIEWSKLLTGLSEVGMSNRDLLNLAMDLKRMSVWEVRGEESMLKVFRKPVMKKVGMLGDDKYQKLKKQISDTQVLKRSEGMLTLAEILITSAIS